MKSNKTGSAAEAGTVRESEAKIDVPVGEGAWRNGRRREGPGREAELALPRKADKIPWRGRNVNASDVAENGDRKTLEKGPGGRARIARAPRSKAKKRGRARMVIEVRRHRKWVRASQRVITGGAAAS